MTDLDQAEAAAREAFIAAVRARALACDAALWVPAAERLPPAVMPQGWSRWLQCCDEARGTDDGPDVFTASYSWMLQRWHRVGNAPVKVTHWRPLPAAPK